jgi:hypothetical protein
MTALTARETQLAEALVRVVDYTGRILLTGLADTSPYYLWDKSQDLANAAERVRQVLDLAEADGEVIRVSPVAVAVAAWSQRYTAGKILFPATRRGRSGD